MSGEPEDEIGAEDILRLPEISRDNLRQFIETRDPDKLEAFLNEIMLQAAVLEQKSHSGPLPTPSDLQHYEDVLAGLAERIVRLAERPSEEYAAEREHRQSIEMALATHSRHYRYAGLIMGFSIAAACVIAAIAFAAVGSVTAALVFLGIPLVGLVGNFVRGAVSVRDKRSEDQA